MKKLIAFALLLASVAAQAQEYTVKSPDKDIKFNISRTSDGYVQYGVTVRGVDIIDRAKIGFTSSEGQSPKVEYFDREGKEVKVKGEWKPLWGKRAVVPYCYNEQSFRMTTAAGATTLQVRVYDEGVAFRSIVTRPGTFYEWTEFRFKGDYTAWYYNGERHNIGPEILSKADGERLPTMTVKAADDLYLAVHEADLGMDGWPMRLKSSAGTTTFKVIPEKIATTSPYTSAWRVIMCADTPGGLVDSHLIELLNPEAEGDFSWVKPGVALWDWRIDGAVWDGYHYGMNYDSWVRMIDFAADRGFRHLVLDANWYGPEFAKDSDPVKGEKARDVQRIIKYGRDKGVGVWLYLNDVAGTNYPIEETLAQYEEWGAAGVKYGFMNGTPLEKNRKTQEITALCAKHHLMVDYHDYPVHPFGQMRTYPNAVTREFCKAQLDGHQIFYPRTFVTSVFVNMVAGPIDQNNGFMELHQGRTTRKDNNQEVPSTATAEIARTMITWSGATVIPDIPEYYKKYPELLEFLAAEKQPWMESRTLDGVIGEYIVMMRQNSEGEYLLAAATNEEGRQVSVPLSFLPKRASYTAYITTDAETSNYLTNREATKSLKLKVDSKSVLTLKMAPGGGACVLFKKN